MASTPSLLTPDQLGSGLARLDGWRVSEAGDSIQKTFKFKNFREAWVFMSRCAEAAERLGHHPAWTNIYNRVEVTLSTHDAGGLTGLDLKLAAAMDGFVSRR